MDGYQSATSRIKEQNHRAAASLEARAALRELAQDPAADPILIEHTLKHLKKKHDLPIRTLRTTFKAIKRQLKNNQDQGLRELFEDGDNRPAARLQLAEHIIEALTCKVKDGTIITYDEETGLYRLDGAARANRLGQELVDEHMTSHTEREVLGHIRRSAPEIEAEEPDINLLCVENGILDIKDKTVKPHTAEHVFFSRLPVKYDDKADCPLFKKFLAEVLDEQDIPIVQEIIGFCLLRAYRFKKAVMLVGSGDNGKSVLLNVIDALLGSDNCSHVSLQSFALSPFLVAELAGKMANIYADLSSQAVKDVGVFNLLTGNDLITAQRKHEQPFKFRNYAKLLFSCNVVPLAYTDTDAYIGRWLIITFSRQFKGKDADPALTDKLTTPEELSGILNYALEGLSRLLEQGGFSQSKSTEEIRADYARKSNPVAAFAEDRIDIIPDAHVSKEDLYATFCTYCKASSLVVCSEQTFFKRIRRHLAGTISDYRPAGDRKMAYRGIRLRTAETMVKQAIEKRQDQTLIVSYDEIKDSCPGLSGDDIDKSLESLKEKGDAYSPEKDKWRLM